MKLLRTRNVSKSRGECQVQKLRCQGLTRRESSPGIPEQQLPAGGIVWGQGESVLPPEGFTPSPNSLPKQIRIKEASNTSWSSIPSNSSSPLFMNCCHRSHTLILLDPQEQEQELQPTLPHCPRCLTLSLAPDHGQLRKVGFPRHNLQTHTTRSILKGRCLFGDRASCMTLSLRDP